MNSMYGAPTGLPVVARSRKDCRWHMSREKNS